MIFCELMEGGIEPKRAHHDDGGYDLFLPEDITVDKNIKIGLKIKLLLPMGWTGLIRPRSSSYKNGVEVNGTIDRYTGEIFLLIKNSLKPNQLFFKKDYAIAQIIPVFTGAGLMVTDFTHTDKRIEDISLTTFILTACQNLRLVEKLPETMRGAKGFGSTDKHEIH